MEPLVRIDTNHAQKEKVFWQATCILFLVFLSFSRWIPGGNPLSPEGGVRGWLEVGIIILDFFFMLAVWGVPSLLAGKSSFAFFTLIGFSLWAMVSSLWAPNMFLAIGKAGDLFILTLLMAAIAYQTAKYELSLTKMILISMLVLVAFLLLINIFVIRSFLNIDWSALRPRLGLAYNHPNISSTYFSTIMLCVIFLFRKPTSRGMAVFYAGIFIFAGALLYFTNSRTSVAALGIVILGCFFFSIKSIHFRLIVLLVGGLLLLLGIALYINGTLDFVLTSNVESLNGRIRLWSEILNKMPANNVSGSGYFSSRFMLLSDISWGFHAHNTYLEVLSTTGWIGFVFLTLFYVSAFPLLRHPQVTPIALPYVIYATLESMMETKLFVPTEMMAVTILLVMYHHFVLRRERDCHVGIFHRLG